MSASALPTSDLAPPGRPDERVSPSRPAGRAPARAVERRRSLAPRARLLPRPRPRPCRAGLQASNDALRDAVRAQAEHGRIARLLIKLGFVNERPEFEHDPAWSETGDRYLLKLLRDALFHQTDETGAPVVNYAHVVRARLARAACATLGLRPSAAAAARARILHGHSPARRLLGCVPQPISARRPLPRSAPRAPLSLPGQVSGLNKLDVGADEHLLLHGRDGANSLLVVRCARPLQRLSCALAAAAAALRPLAERAPLLPLAALRPLTDRPLLVGRPPRSYRDLRTLLESAFADLVAAQQDAALEQSELSEQLSVLSDDGADGYGQQ